MQKVKQRMQKVVPRGTNCFLCKKKVDSTTQTLEHVFPQWAQRKYDLWDQPFTLLNKTTIPYRNFTVPCCSHCNGTLLKPIEDHISLLAKKGFKEFSKEVDKKMLFFWVGKIFYGIIYKQLFLLKDRKNQEGGAITTPEFLKEIEMHRQFLLGVNGKHDFVSFFPTSIFLIQTQKPEDIRHQWEYFDNYPGMSVAIQMGDIGIISVLQDNQMIESIEGFLQNFDGVEINNFRFRNMAAQIFYASLLRQSTPPYFSIIADGHTHF